MSDTTPKQPSQPATINLKEEIAHSEWKSDPIVGFEQRASLVIAQWVLIIFGAVYLLAFIGVFILLCKADITFEKGSELVRFMITSLLPLVTLVVGYYLGDRNRQQQQTAKKR